MIERREVRYQAAVLREHHVLLIKIFDRADGSEVWIFPGGGREPGESEEACLRRELQEETGLEVAVGPLLFETPVRDEELYSLLKTFRCAIVAGEPQPGTEPELDHDGVASIRDVGWFDLREPTTWGPDVARAKATVPLLLQLCAALGYTHSRW